MTKPGNIYDLSALTAKHLAAGEWPGFLHTAAWNFRFSFDGQMLIYAQRPDATACYSFDDWNKRFDRRIKKHTKGIALIDDSKDQLSLEYVFDYSDTYSRKGQKLTPWELTQSKESAVLDTLHRTFFPDSPEAENMSAAINSAVFSLLEEDMATVLPDFESVRETCRLHELDPNIAERTFRALIVNSATAMVMYRCGYDPAPVLPENAFAGVPYFDTLDALSVLGNTVQHISKQILREVALTVARWDKDHSHEEEKTNENERNDISAGRGVSDPQSEHAPAAPDQQVRTDAQEISAGAPEESVHQPSSARETDGTSASDRAGDYTSDVSDDGRFASEAAGATEGREQLPLDAAHGHAPETSRGTGASGDDLSLTVFTAADIEAAVFTGSRVEGGKFRIQKAALEKVETLPKFLREEYGIGGCSFRYPDGKLGHIDHDAKGLQLRKPGCDDLYLSWTSVAKHVESMAQEDRFLSDIEKANYDRYWKDRAALEERQLLGEELRAFVGIFEPDRSKIRALDEPIRAFVYEHSENARMQLLEGLGTYMELPSVSGDQNAVSTLTDIMTALGKHARKENSKELPSAYDAGLVANFPTDKELNEREAEREEPLNRDPLDDTPELTNAIDIPLPEEELDLAVAEGQLLSFAGGFQYIVLSVQNDRVTLQDTEHPLFTQTMPLAAVQTILANNINWGEANRLYSGIDSRASIVSAPEPSHVDRINDVKSNSITTPDVSSKHAQNEPQPNNFRAVSVGDVYIRDASAYVISSLEEGNVVMTNLENNTVSAPVPMDQLLAAVRSDPDAYLLSMTFVGNDDNSIHVGGHTYTFAPNDVLQYDQADFEIESVYNGMVRARDLNADHKIYPTLDFDLVDQISGGEVRLIPGWNRNNMTSTYLRQDQRILAHLLYHFEHWRTDKDIYIHGDYYAGIMDRMANMRVSENEAENRKNILYAAYTIEHFFPQIDSNNPNRATFTNAFLNQADEYLYLDPDFQNFGSVIRMAEWREGGEEALYRDLAALCRTYYDNTLPTALRPLVDNPSDYTPFDAIPVLHEYLASRKPAIYGDVFPKHSYDNLVKAAGFHADERKLLYPDRNTEPLIDHPEVLRTDISRQDRADKVVLTDLLKHYGDYRETFHQMMAEPEMRETFESACSFVDTFLVTDDIDFNLHNIELMTNFLGYWYLPLSQAMSEEYRQALNRLLAEAENISSVDIPRENESVVAEEPIAEDIPTDKSLVPDIVFHEGDEYRDDFGGGIISNIVEPSEDGRTEGAFGYYDQNAGRGFVMSWPAALERIRNGEATLIPASKVQKQPPTEEVLPEEEEDITLFDFENPIPVKPAKAVPVQASQATTAPESRVNFCLPEDTVPLGGPKARFQHNLAAIRLLKRLEAEDRLATAEEQETLAKYVGWGGLADAFDPRKENWRQEYTELKELLTEDEYEAAQESTLTAFYTPPEVIDAVYSVLSNLGFEKGNVLDPGCGTGLFSGRLPDSMSESKIYGIEKDSLSGRIGRQLFQKNNIAIEGYEETKLPDNFFDVAVGNVPFNNFKVYDRKYDHLNLLVHDYFFAKTLDKVRPGGVIAFVTSSGTLDKQSTEFRRYLSQRADLLGAIRLPNNTFKTNAGTEVTSDIIFLQKRDFPRVEEADWVDLDRSYDYDKEEWGPEVNAYFAQNPEMVLGDLKMVSGPHGPELACIAREGEDLKSALREAVQNIQGKFLERESGLYDQEFPEKREAIPADPDVRNYSFTLVDDHIYFREDSEMYPTELNKTAEQRVRGLIQLRDDVRDLIDAQLEDQYDTVIAQLQRKLNDDYDAFTKKYGLINSRGNELAFSDDSSYYLLCSLEHINDETGEFLGKADMFFKRTIGAHQHIDHVDSAEEALTISMGERGRIDFGYMSRLSGMPEEDLIAQLKGKIFEDPTAPGRYEIAALYLSGNVREKLDYAREAEEEEPGRWTVNVKALEAIQPKDLEPGDITIRLGSTWIPAEDITEFMYQLFSTPEWYKKDGRVQVEYSRYTNSWNITNINYDNWNTKANSTYGSKRVSGYKLLMDALNLKDPKVYDTVYENGVEKRVLNQNDTMEAQEKQQLIKDAFKEWVWSDPDRAERLCKEYNRRFNAYVPPVFDGDMLRFHNMNPEVTMRPWQKNAIARILFNGNTLLDHAVGAGKTWTMSAAAMEGKALGLCNKSMIVVPNHLVGQWAKAIYDQYPNAKVLASTKKDFETKNRKKFCSRIATGDYDVIVIGHSQFERIPLSAERQKAGIQNEIDTIVEAIRELKREDSQNFSIKQMERMKKSLEGRLEKLNNSKKRDDVITFEELGVDRLFIDESHNYKNLFLYTKMTNVAGISQTDSQRASDLFLKCRYMDEVTGNKGNIHATGTVLSNTMAELYAAQRYLSYDLLQEMDLGTFDQWASTFGETITSVELAPEGTGFRARTRFAKFFNIPELMSLYCQVADIQTKEMLDLPLPTAHYDVITIPASDTQKKYVEDFAERAKKIRNGSCDRSKDNMLCITNDGRKLALDQRLMEESLPDEPISKVNACVEKVFERWEAYKDQKATQLIFCDLSTPKPGVFNVYDDIKKKLIAKGIPSEEIRFIHEAKNDAQKESIFQKVRDGDIRILLGSTSKLGTGTNVQDRLIASYDLDVPYRPSDLEQRLGRTVRQGNMHDDVFITRVVTENTFDAYMYQLLEIKQRFNAQIHNPNPTVREAADLDEISLSFAEIKALASGDPRIKERVELEADVQRLTMLESRHENAQHRLNIDITRTLPERIESKTRTIQKLKEDLSKVKSRPSRTKDGHLLPVNVKGVTYEKSSDAGEAIRKAAKKAPMGERTLIGSLRGFDLYVDRTEQHSASDLRYLQLSGASTYRMMMSESDSGTVLRLNNILDKDIENDLELANASLLNYQKQLEDAKAEYGKPFPRAKEIAEKRSRLEQLAKELDIDAQEHPVLSEQASVAKKPTSLDNIIQSASGRLVAQTQQHAPPEYERV